MRIGLTYDLQQDPTDERQAEFDPPRVIEALCRSVEELGHRVVRLGNAFDLLASTHWTTEIDLAFNIAEGSHGRCREAWVANVLELFKVPYVGSDPLALSLGLDKAMSKRLAVACGVPTPRWIMVEDAGEIPAVMPLSFPLIVKPRYEGSGIGIDEGAVVHSRAALVRRVRWLAAQWQEPIILEEFIPHGELTVCVIGNGPPTAYPAIQRPLDPRTRLSCHVVQRNFASRNFSSAVHAWDAPLELSEALDATARRIALAMFGALGCRDMARIDLRVDEAGTVFFLEINPLPSFDPEGSFGLLAEHLRMTYSQLIGQIIEAARLRIPCAAQQAASSASSAVPTIAQQHVS